MSTIARFAAAAAVASAAILAAAQGPFTYQGRLTNQGAPVNGPTAMTFTLYDALSGGDPVGSPIVLSGVMVVDGLFSVELNAAGEFGPDAFNGASRWLEVNVGGAPLSPRTPILPAPYAHTVPGVDGWSLDADGGAVADAVYVQPGGVVEVGQIPQYGAPTLDQSNVSFNNSAVSPAGRWQSFRPAVSGQLSAVHIRVDNFGSPFASIGLEIREGVGASGALLHFVSKSTPPGVNWVQFGVPNIPVNAGQDYTWRILFAGSHLIFSADFNPYARGQGDLGGNIDYMFETYVRPFSQTPVMSVLPSGRVGIGTDAPAQALSVAGMIESTSQGFRFPDGTVQDSAAVDSLWAANGPDVYITGGFVGVGTNAPGKMLEIESAADPQILIDDTSSGGRDFTLGSHSADDSFRVVDAGANRNLLWLTNNGLAGINLSSAPDAPLTFRANNAAGESLIKIRNSADNLRWTIAMNSNRLRFTPDPLTNWTVEFGDTAARALSVNGATLISDGDLTLTNGDVKLNNGDLNVVGQTTTSILHITGGSDIAEPFNVSTRGAAPGAQESGAGRIEPGMVVVIDAERVGELRLSDRAYDTAVAGVISGAGGVNAGMVLSQEGSIADGKHPVAMTGRVWCWVDADQGGPVKPGDLLTTSETAGHAMKAADRDRAGGATIGKAMSSLHEGRGLVLVLVNLQ